MLTHPEHADEGPDLVQGALTKVVAREVPQPLHGSMAGIIVGVVGHIHYSPENRPMFTMRSCFDG